MTYILSFYAEGDKHPYAIHRADEIREDQDGNLILRYEGCFTTLSGFSYYMETAYDLGVPEDVKFLEEALKGLSNLEAQFAASAGLSSPDDAPIE